MRGAGRRGHAWHELQQRAVLGGGGDQGPVLLAVERALGPPLDALPAARVLQRLRIVRGVKKTAKETAGCLVQGVGESNFSESRIRKAESRANVFGRTVGQIPSEVAASRSRFPKWSCT